MPQVVVTINTRTYAVACGEGEEEHLLRLAAVVDERVTSLAREVGQVGDARLMLMASLLMADDLEQAEAKAHDAAEAIDGARRVQSEVEDRISQVEAKSAAYVERLAQRVEAMAARLQPAA
ncbi:MAG: cell division protein ZapA [Alphaproteobacteria bacterium]|nr:cell division protein ZapA [Alphaproteobacteria bacterium]